MQQYKEINAETDGSIESLIFILIFFGHKYLNFCFDNLFQIYKEVKEFEALEVLASKFNLFAISCKNATVDELKEIKYPTIINIGNHPYKNHKIICFGYESQHGFAVKDYRNGEYYISEYAMNSLWTDKECWVFFKR